MYFCKFDHIILQISTHLHSPYIPVACVHVLTFPWYCVQACRYCQETPIHNIHGVFWTTCATTQHHSFYFSVSVTVSVLCSQWTIRCVLHSGQQPQSRCVGMVAGEGSKLKRLVGKWASSDLHGLGACRGDSGPILLWLHLPSPCIFYPVLLCTC